MTTHQLKSMSPACEIITERTLMMTIIQLLRICKNRLRLMLCIRISMWIRSTIHLDQWQVRIHNMTSRSPKTRCISTTKAKNTHNPFPSAVPEDSTAKTKSHLFSVLVHPSLNQLLQISIMKHLKKNHPLVFCQIQFVSLKLNWMVKILKK